MIRLILIATGAVLVHELEASHNVIEPYSGSGLIPIANDGALIDTENTPLQCAISGSTNVDIVWKWRNGRTPNTDHYFTWVTTHISFGGSKLSSSTISFKNNLPETDKRNASGVIYAEGAHTDDPNVKTECRDVSLTFIWKPDGTPVLSVNKSPLEIGTDSTAQLTCQLTDKGNPEGQVRWIRNGILQSELDYNSQNISIPVTREINGDKWQCYYYNAAGDGNYSNEVTINVNYKPEGNPALSVSKKPLDIEQDSTVQLTCQLTNKGNPVGQVRWRRNGNLQGVSVYNTHTITISVTKDIDGDTWLCYYYNTVGDGDNSNEVVVNVHWKPAGTPVLSLNKSPLEIGKDSTAQLTCQLADKGNPEGQVRWIKSGNLQSKSEHNTQTISIPVTNDINGDKWQCYYYNAAGDGIYSNEVTINVNWKPEGTPVQSVSKNPLDIEQDSTVQLTCQLTNKSNPVGQVRWRKNGNLQGKLVYNTQTITISVTKDTDGDRWQCYYYNTVGEGDNSNEVAINVHWKAEGTPSLSVIKNPLVIDDDSTAQLTCELTDKGNPEGQVRWLKDGNLQSKSEYNTETISIPVTKDIDGDKWQCYYHNAAGDGDYSNVVTINVHRSPGGATISADTQTPKRDDTLTFTCAGDRGNPPGRVLWYFNDTVVANTTNRQHMITNVQESRNGNWSCMFNNYLKNGLKSQSIQIQVLLTPEQGEVRITSVTARSAVVNVTPKTNAQKARRSIRSTTITNMIITWYSYDQNNTVLVPPYTTQYALYNLTANTTYTVDVSYVNSQGIGAAATAYVTTKEFPLNQEVEPSIKRSWFSAVATLDIANSNSVARVEMLVCESKDEMNCVNESTTDIKKGTLEVKETSINGRYVTLSLYDEGFLIAMFSDDIDAPIVAFVLIALGGLLVIVLIIVVIVVIIKKQGKGGKETAMTRGAADGGTDTYSYSNPTMMANSQSRTGTGHAKALNAQPVYAEVPKGRTLAPIAVSADGGIYSQVEMSKKNARQSLKGLPMSKKAIDRIIFHKKDGYVNMTFQVRKKFTGDIEIGVCRVGDQSCTSKVSKQHEGGSKDVVMVLPIEEMSPESYSIHMKFIERGQVTQTVDLTYPYNKNLVNVAVLNEVYGTTASHNDRPTNVVPQRPARQGAPGEGVTYAVMDWNRSQAPGRPPRLSSRSPAQEHVVYADVRPGGNVY